MQQQSGLIDPYLAKLNKYDILLKHRQILGVQHTPKLQSHTLTGSMKGFLQLRKEVPSWPRVAVMRVRAMAPGLSPTPEKLYSHSPTASLYSDITASSVDPAVTFTSHVYSLNPEYQNPHPSPQKLSPY